MSAASAVVQVVQVVQVFYFLADKNVELKEKVEGERETCTTCATRTSHPVPQRCSRGQSKGLFSPACP
jgi:hypothetical protein